MGVDRAYLRARIREARDAMRNLIRLTSKPFESLSPDERYSMRYHVIVLAEAVGSICVHIALEDLNYEPTSFSDCVSYLSQAGLLDCAEDIISMFKLRNLLVHRYWVIDDRRVISSVREDFKCVEDFFRRVEERYGLR